MIPKISIIIPTLNRAKSLKRTIDSILLNKFDDYEIIIVDNGSNDCTNEIYKCFSERCNIKYLYNNEPGLLTGRHVGFFNSKAALLCYLDDDVEISENYIENLIKTFEDPSIELATGPSYPKFEKTPPKWLEYLWDKTSEGKFCAWLSLLDFGDHQQEIYPNYVWGLNFCIRKKTFINLGGFHPDSMPYNLQKYQGDGETGLTFKAIINNSKAIYNPKLYLYHHIATERCELSYFKKRAYFQGVCNSFTEIRNIYLNKNYINKKEVTRLRRFRNMLHPYYKWLKKKEDVPQNKPPVKILNILLELKLAEKEGYDFHQKSFKNDPLVKKWVLKENYWDYLLPTH